MSAAIYIYKKKIQPPRQYILFLGRSTEQKLWYIGKETRTPIHLTLGSSTVWIEFQTRFQKKKTRFRLLKKAKLNKTLWRIISGDIHKLVCKVRCKKMLLYLDFRSYFEATGPNCFNVFWKVLLQSIFLARIISWRPKRAKKSVSWNVVATSLLGNLGYQTKRKKDLWQKQNCSGAACLQWHHAAKLNWDAVMTVARQVRIPNQ